MNEKDEMKLSEADKKALGLLKPGVWYSDDLRFGELPPFEIARPAYRLRRLYERGAVEWNVVGTIPDLGSIYKVKEPADDQQ